MAMNITPPIPTDLGFIFKLNQHHSVQQNASTVAIENIDIAFLTQSTVAFCFNVCLLIFIISRNKLRNKKSTKIFLNLQSVHILLSITGTVTTFYLPDEAVIINNGLLMELFLTLIITSSDRYVAIQYPYKYEEISKRNVLVIIT